LKEEFSDDLLMIWEFTSDYTFKRRVQVKYYAIDELLGLLGGNLSIYMAIGAYFIGPY